MKHLRAFLIAAASLLLVGPAFAQLTPLTEGGARHLALGRATTALGGDPWGIANPASWALVNRGTAAAFASQAFGMAELRLAAAAVAVPTPYGTAAAAARTYGFADFRETVVGAGIGRSFTLSPTRRLHAGAALRYTSVSIPDFGSAGAAGLSLGLQVELMPGLDFGAMAHNLNRPGLSQLDPLESRLDAGLAFRPHDLARVVGAISKDLDYPLSVRAGLEVQPVDVLFVRAGFSTEPARFAAGVGVALGMIAADVAVDHHAFLGWSPAFGVSVQW